MITKKSKTYPLKNIAGNDSPTETENKTKVYKRRWYILFVFSISTCTQAAVWNTWGPIAASSEKAFGWDDSMLALLPNWGPIGYILTAVPFSWIVHVKGLRVVCVLGATLSAIGTCIRCFTSEPPYVTWTANIGQFLNGLSGPVAMGVSPALSAVWFPPHERTTSTGISTTFNYAGVGLAFLIGPYMVPEHSKMHHGNTSFYNVTHTNASAVTLSTTEDISTEIKEIRRNIMVLQYVECGWTVFVWLLMALYFPAKPEIPPSITASIERLDFKSGFKGLMRNKMFWILCLTYGISNGVFALWDSVINVNLKPHDITEKQSGWIGFYSIIAGCFGALIISRFADVFSKHMKFFLVLAFSLAAVCFLWLCLLLNGNIPMSVGQIYAAIIIGTLFMNSAPPLFYEMACESTYPVSEGITNFMLTLSLNVVGLIFLGVQMIQGIGTIWMNWCLLATTVLPIPIFIMMGDIYSRLDVDEKGEEDKTT